MSKPTYVVKVGLKYLSLPQTPWANYYSDSASPWETIIAVEFTSKVKAAIVARLVGGVVVDMANPILFEVSETYLTIGGKKATVLREYNDLEGYETIMVSIDGTNDGHRYNRSTKAWCNGRITGSKWTEDCLQYPPVKVNSKG